MSWGYEVFCGLSRCDRAASKARRSSAELSVSALTPPPFITRWFGPILSTLCRPAHRLFGAHSALIDEASQWFPPTAIWGTTALAGSVLFETIKQISQCFKWLLVLLFRHRAKSSIAQEERLATSYNRWSNVVILTPGTAVTVGVWAVPHPCRQIFSSRTEPWRLPGPRHRTLFTCFLLGLHQLSSRPAFFTARCPCNDILMTNSWHKCHPVIIERSHMERPYFKVFYYCF